MKKVAAITKYIKQFEVSFLMKIKVLFMIVVVCFLMGVLGGCTPPQEEVVVSQPLTLTQFNAVKIGYSCTFDDVEYFIYNKIAFNLDDKERAHINIKDGSYIQKEDKSGWTFKRWLNQDTTSFYRHIEETVLQGETEWGSPVVCKDIEKIPETFAIFLTRHSRVRNLYV